jgi:LAO/AO transport system kinase
LASVDQLVDAILKGERRGIARAITLIENDAPKAQKILSALYESTGKAQIIGVTGPSGVGKSTLIEKMIRELRKRGKTVGVVAVDPTSPFSGGALLGDRIRMQDIATDDGVFIRSMATRNNPGGLAKASRDAVRVLDASGKDVAIVETVGAGQSEVEIVRVAQTVVVVLAPGLGDEIQAIKAGLMEIGDIFVINKADRENANKAVSDIHAALELSSKQGVWTPLIVRTVALTGEGVFQLLEKINEHKKYLDSGGAETRRRQMVEVEFIEAVKQKAAEYLAEELRQKGRLDRLITEILEKKVNPYTAAEKLLAEKFKSNE